MSHTFAEFFVDGTTIPEVSFDVGPSWAGLLPISGAPNETRQVWFQSKIIKPLSPDPFQLFFWLFPPGPQGSPDDLILWYVFHSLTDFEWTHVF